MTEAGRTVVVLQPMFFPWVGHLEQVRLADTFVHYDDVQYCPRTLCNRVAIKTRQGRAWLTVPVEHPGRRSIDQVRIHASDWRKQHLRTLQHAFAKAPFRADALQLVEQVYATPTDSLAELCIASVEALAAYFELPTGFRRSSQLAVEGSATERLVGICRTLGADAYVTGHGARHYLQHEAFEAHGIDVAYMAYHRTPYAQQFGPFDPHVSALDLVANCGRQGRAVIASGTVPWRDFVLTPAHA